MKHLKLLAWMSILLILCDCQPDQTAYMEEADYRSLSIDENASEASKLFTSLINDQKDNAQEFWKTLSSAHTPLLEYTEANTSGDFGRYYAIPYKDSSDSIIGCIVYPVDKLVGNVEERSFIGELGTPIDLNEDYLLHYIPITSRFLYSATFLRWKEKGLKVSHNLTSFAEILKNKDITLKQNEMMNSRGNTYWFPGYGEDIFNIEVKYTLGTKPAFGGIISLSSSTLKKMIKEELQRFFPEMKNLYINDFHFGLFDIKFNFDDNQEILRSRPVTSYIEWAMQDVINKCMSMGFWDTSIQYIYTIPKLYYYENESPTYTGGAYVPPGQPQEEPDIRSFEEDCSNAEDMYTKKRIAELHSILKQAIPHPQIPNSSNFQTFLDLVNKDSIEYSASLQHLPDPEYPKELQYTLTNITKGEKYNVNNYTNKFTVATIHNHINLTPPSFRDVLFTAKKASESNNYKATFIVYHDYYYILAITDYYKAKNGSADIVRGSSPLPCQPKIIAHL